MNEEKEHEWSTGGKRYYIGAHECVVRVVMVATRTLAETLDVRL